MVRPESGPIAGPVGAGRVRIRTLLPRCGGREHARDTVRWVSVSHCECMILETSSAFQVPGATLGADVAVTFPAGCVQPTRESLGWGLPEGGGRCDTLPGHAQPPPWAPHVTSPLSFTPPPLVYLPRPEGCLCRFFLRSEQGRGLTFQTVWLMVPFPSSLSSTFGPARVRTFSQVWTPPCL